MKIFHQDYDFTLVLFSILTLSTTAEEYSPLCPYGYNLTYDNTQDNHICYKLKGLESFRDKYRNCNGNLYNLDLHRRLNVTNTRTKIWTDFISLYPGGPFAEWKHGNYVNDIIFNVTYEFENETLKELCLISDDNEYFAVDCKDMYNRYCFIKPYSEIAGIEECDDNEPSFKFYSPEKACLLKIKTETGLNWKQAKKLCESETTTLLSNGWIHTNADIFNRSSKYPVGKIDNSELVNAIRDDTIERTCDYPKGDFETNNSFAWVIQNGSWQNVDENYKFSEIICEKYTINKYIKLDLVIDIKNQIILTANDDLDEKDIFCHTDSMTYYPSKVKVHRCLNDQIFLLTPMDSGYYWCVHVDPKTSQETSTSRVLFIKEGHNLWHSYAVMINVDEYNVESLDIRKIEWKEKLEEIFIKTRCEKNYNNGTYENCDGYNESVKELSAETKKGQVIREFKVKRVYVDKRTVLLHVDLNFEIPPLAAGVWEDMEILYMRPVYYCTGKLDYPYECVGDFNVGMEWKNISSCKEIENDEEFIHNVKAELKSDNDIIMEKCFDCELSLSNTEDSSTAGTTDINITESTFTPPPIACNETTTEQTTSAETTLNYTTTDVTTTIITTAETLTTTDISTSSATESTTESCTTETTTSESTTDLTTAEVTTIASSESTTTETITTVSTEFTTESTSTETTTVITTETSTETTQYTTTTPTPENLIEQILDDLEQLLHDETSTFFIDDIIDTFGQVNNILNHDQDVVIPGELLQMLDLMASRVHLNGSLTGMVVEDNIAMLMADAGPENPVLGISVAARETDEFTEEGFNFYTEFADQLSADTTEAGVFLPSSVVTSDCRISFIVYRDDRAFSGSQDVFSVNSRVISINVTNFIGFEPGEVVNIHTNPMTEDLERNMSRGCGYWEFLGDGTGYWSQDGCTFIRSRAPGTLDICRCDHLTNFAEILVPRSVFSQRNENILEAISITGCSLSILGLSAIILTSVIFISWRKNFRNQVWLQLCISLLIMNICFIIVVFADFDYNTISCVATGIMLHYSLLASFCWMLVVATKSYRDLVIVFSKQVPRKFLLASSFSWGFPFIVIVILIASAPRSYLNRFAEKNPNGNFCYPSGLALWLSVFAPVCVMLFANCVLFVLIVRKIGVVPKNLRYQRAGDKREALHCARVSTVLVFFFGLPWIFGLLAQNIVAAYLFTCTASFQGFVLFVFIVLGNFETRNLWWRKLRPKKVMNNTFSGRSVTMLY
ncbi:adhesion G protein-coupled receptor L3 [Amyelois transitella]|uniref:adhesion G protein-coupled receptor L3 n=1 Tax=Amyelois transitella TaxID=680683 RepID=UPI00067C242E|nr:adhesion G protein-coupled receptor L3 [Amyelois transitella]